MSDPIEKVENLLVLGILMAFALALFVIGSKMLKKKEGSPSGSTPEPSGNSSQQGNWLTSLLDQMTAAPTETSRAAVEGALGPALSDDFDPNAPMPTYTEQTAASLAAAFDESPVMNSNPVKESWSDWLSYRLAHI